MKDNPYVGPASIPGGRRLYGRDREVCDLADLLITERIVLLYSPSGAGKSSLLAAGLIPAMAKRRFTTLPVMRVKTAPPPDAGFDPKTGNRYVLSCLMSLEGEEGSKSKAELARMTLSEYLGEEANGELLVFDQFEEILTVEPLDRDEKIEFFMQVGEALRVRGRWAIFAMREDYLAGLDPYSNYVPTRFSNTFRLDLLDEQWAIEAVRGPAEERGVTFTEEAATELVKNLRQVNVHNDDGTVTSKPGRWVEPVQLQVVCRRLWEQLGEGTKEIGLGHLASVGNVDAALGGYYSATVAAVAKEKGVDERDLRDWFDKELITKANTRGQVVEGDDETVRVAAAIRPLVDAHLVRSDKRLGSVWYELAHDRLIAPVLAENKEWRKTALQPLQKQAELWVAKGRSKEYLLTGKALEEALRWAASNRTRAEEEELLRLSVEDQARRQELVEVQAQRQRLVRLRWVATGAALLAVIGAVGIYKGQRKLRDVVAEAQRDAAQWRAEGWKEKERLIAEAKAEQDAMRLNVLREISIESMLDAAAAGGEVKALDGAWTTLAAGPQKLAFAIARDGAGRVIGVGHDGFLNYRNSAGGSLFLRMAIEWLKRERTGPIVIVLGENVNDGKDLAPRLQVWGYDAVESSPRDHIPPAGVLEKASMLIVTHRMRLGDGDVERVGKFVGGGGGLLVTGYGWVWVKYDVHNGQDVFGAQADEALNKYPVNLLMRQFGVRWTNEVARWPLR